MLDSIGSVSGDSRMSNNYSIIEIEMASLPCMVLTRASKEMWQFIDGQNSSAGGGDFFW